MIQRSLIGPNSLNYCGFSSVDWIQLWLIEFALLLWNWKSVSRWKNPESQNMEKKVDSLFSAPVFLCEVYVFLVHVWSFFPLQIKTMPGNLIGDFKHTFSVSEWIITCHVCLCCLWDGLLTYPWSITHFDLWLLIIGTSSPLHRVKQVHKMSVFSHILFLQEK